MVKREIKPFYGRYMYVHCANLAENQISILCKLADHHIFDITAAYYTNYRHRPKSNGKECLRQSLIYVMYVQSKMYNVSIHILHRYILFQNNIAFSVSSQIREAATIPGDEEVLRHVQGDCVASEVRYHRSCSKS